MGCNLGSVCGLSFFSIFYIFFKFLCFFVAIHYVNVSVLIKFSQKTSVFTLIIISPP